MLTFFFLETYSGKDSTGNVAVIDLKGSKEGLSPMYNNMSDILHNNSSCI